MNQSVLKLCAKTIVREHRLGALTHILCWDLMCLNAMQMDSTYHSRLAWTCHHTLKYYLLLRLSMYKQTYQADLAFPSFYVSVIVPLDTVGVWTGMDRREQEPGLLLEHQLQSVTDQVSLLCLVVLTIRLRGGGMKEKQDDSLMSQIQTFCRMSGRGGRDCFTRSSEIFIFHS